MLNLMPNLYTTFVLCLCTTLMACGPGGQSVKSADDQARLEAESTARDLISVGNFSAAANEYLRLAEEDRGHAILYQLGKVFSCL